MESEVARAQGMCRRFADLIDDAVQSRLRASNVAPSPRVREALDYLFARKVPYVSEPRFFRLPGLPSVPFYSDLSAWVQSLEAATDEIEAELRGVLSDRGAFNPYLVAPPDSLEARQNALVNNPDWSACYLWRGGSIVEENACRCPKTMEAIGRIPLYQIPGRSPSVLFSLMLPGAHILPHNGLINSRLIGHLPLIVPERCTFRVGNDIREWKRGKVWLFDDTIEHEAWNNSNEPRVVLIFEVARQDVRSDEHAAISQIFQALDSESGNAIRWEI
jgi:aspartyl/asparaginyl beta-hydroxylase (cupin superfamily)